MSNEDREESLRDVMARMEATTISFLDQIGAHINEAKGRNR